RDGWSCSHSRSCRPHTEVPCSRKGPRLLISWGAHALLGVTDDCRAKSDDILPVGVQHVSTRQRTSLQLTFQDHERRDHWPCTARRAAAEHQVVDAAWVNACDLSARLRSSPARSPDSEQASCSSLLVSVEQSSITMRPSLWSC